MRAALTGLRRLALVAALLALLVGLGNRPAPEAQRLPGLDVLVAVDRTTSMSALDDPSGSRLTAVRRDLTRLGELLDSASFSLVTFGQSTTVALPFTTDRVAYDDAVRKLQVEEPTAGTGSSVGRPVSFLTDELDRTAKAEDLDRRQAEDRVRVLVLVTDGENTSPEPQASFAPIADRIDAGVVLGFGTVAGGVMPLERVPVGEAPPPADAPGRVITVSGTGADAVSHLDPANLGLIAGQLGVAYVPADASLDLPALAASLENAAYADLPPVEPERELRWLWALLVLALALPELRLGWRALVESLREGRR